MDFWKSFSRGASSALAGKSAGKSFLKGAGVKVGPKGILGVAAAGTEKGLGTVFNNYDLYGKDGIKRFGSRFYWQSFAAGFAGGAIKDGLGIGFNKIKGFAESGFPVGTIGLNSVAGDVTKKILLKSMSKEYKNYLKENKKDDWLTFFNGFAQTLMFHSGE